MALEMRQVFSSHVEEIGYDEEKQELHVLYKTGKTSVYSGVSPAVAGQVLSSPSIGEALWGMVRGRYEHGYAAQHRRFAHSNFTGDD